MQIVGRGTVIRHDILAGFENAVGSFHDDHLIGNAEANELSGGNGDDTLTGAGGGRHRCRAGPAATRRITPMPKAACRLDLGRARNAGDSYSSIENLVRFGLR